MLIKWVIHTVDLNFIKNMANSFIQKGVYRHMHVKSWYNSLRAYNHTSLKISHAKDGNGVLKEFPFVHTVSLHHRNCSLKPFHIFLPSMVWNIKYYNTKSLMSLVTSCISKSQSKALDLLQDIIIYIYNTDLVFYIHVY